MEKLLESLKLKKDNSKIYKGEIVDLKERYKVSENSAFDGVPTIYYDILLHDTNTRVGKCDLRLKLDDKMYYYGHIGYNVFPEERGHHYAYHACKILFKIAKEEHGFKELYITCNPDNEPSYKTLKALNGELVEVAEIPKDHELYIHGDKYKCVFKYRIDLLDESNL